jgi:hypothetical protein
MGVDDLGQEDGLVTLVKIRESHRHVHRRTDESVCRVSFCVKPERPILKSR